MDCCKSEISGGLRGFEVNGKKSQVELLGIIIGGAASVKIKELSDGIFYKDICEKICDNEDKNNTDLKDFRIELFKNKKRMRYIIDSIVNPLRKIKEYGVFSDVKEFKDFLQTIATLFRKTFFIDNRIASILKKDNEQIQGIKGIDQENFNIFNHENLNYERRFYRALYYETHKFEKSEKIPYRFGVSVIEFRNARVQGVYRTTDNNTATDGIWIYNNDWAKEFINDVENSRIQFVKDNGFINFKKSKNKRGCQSKNDILGQKPKPYYGVGKEQLLNDKVDLGKVCEWIKTKQTAKITQTYEANTPEGLYQILKDKNLEFQEANPSQLLFIVLTESECGSDRGEHAGLKYLRQIVQGHIDKIKESQKQGKFISKIFKEDIEEDFLFTEVGGLRKGCTNIKDGIWINTSHWTNDDDFNYSDSEDPDADKYT